MAVRIEDIRIQSVYNDGETKFLLGNIGDEITIEVDFVIEEYSIDGGGDPEITLAPNESTVTIERQRLINSSEAIFENFKEEDEIRIVDVTSVSVGVNAGDYTIVRKIDNFNVIVDRDLVNANLTANDYIALITPVQGVEYKYNFISNDSSEDFESLVDGEVQKLSINSADASILTPQPMVFGGLKSYQIGSVSLIGRGIDASGSQKFTIVHNTFITPFFLANQLQDLQNNIAPEYFKSDASLSYVLELNAGRSVFDLNTMQSSIGFERLIGNVGWFNENFNGNPTNYKIENLAYDNALGTIDFENNTQITFTVTNPTSSFAPVQLDSVFGIVYLPENENEYQNNGKDFAENFLFDRVRFGYTQQDGINEGTDAQIILQGEQVKVSDTEIQVTIDIVCSEAIKQTLREKENPNFLIYFSVQEFGSTVSNSDRVTLLVDVNQYQTQLTTTNLITNSTAFLQHYTNVDTVTSFCVNPVDDIIAKSTFSIDFTGLESDGIRIQEIENRVVLKKSGETDIVLDSTAINVLNSPLNGLGQYINVNQLRQFVLDSTNVRNQILITSETPVGNVYTWNVSYPFISRFEYWQSLNINTLPIGLFDPLEPNNGLNQDWFRLFSQAGWSIDYELRFEIQQNSEVFEQVFATPLDLVDFESNPDWINETIDTFDSTGVTNLNKKLVGFEDTLIKASFEYAGGTAPSLADVDIVIWINTKEVGGVNTIFKASSVYELETLQPFKSIDASNKVVVSESGGVFTGEVFVDYTKITPSKDFTLYARLYDKTTIPVTAKLLENGELKTLEDAEIKIIE